MKVVKFRRNVEGFPVFLGLGRKRCGGVTQEDRIGSEERRCGMGMQVSWVLMAAGAVVVVTIAAVVTVLLIKGKRKSG